jgi:hypothetical protein
MPGYEGVKRVEFQTASAGADWVFPYRLLVPGINGWDKAVDLVVLGMSPDAVSWDDYGLRSRSFPDAPGYDTAPFYQASSDDGSGVVSLLDPNLISIVVPHNAIRQMGPGGVNVGIQYRQKDTGSRAQLLIGRLPLVAGVL